MHRPPPRRFTLVDAMVLIAATAVGIGMVRSECQGSLKTLIERPEGGWDVQYIAKPIDSVACLCLAPWTVALIALRLRHPRPHPQQMGRQLGTVACRVAGLAMAFGALLLVAGWLFSAALHDHKDGLLTAFMIRWHLIEDGELASYCRVWLFRFPGVVVSVTWIAMLLNRRWRCEASWIDRCGRVLGACWILHCIVESLYDIEGWLNLYMTLNRVP